MRILFFKFPEEAQLLSVWVNDRFFVKLVRKGVCICLHYSKVILDLLMHSSGLLPTHARVVHIYSVTEYRGI